MLWFMLSPVLLCRLLKGLSVALALDVQFPVLEPKELDDSDFPRFSELTFFVLLVAVLLQSAINKQHLFLNPWTVYKDGRRNK